MRFNVSQIKKQLGATEKAEFIEEIPGDFLPKQVKLNDPVKVQVSATNTGDSILLKGQLETQLTMQCNRCLVEFKTDAKAKLEEEYYPLVEGDVDVSLPEGEYATYQNNFIELTPLVQEAILLSIPMKPLCKETCQGLCPQCGQNLNLESCDCVQDDVDIRLEALKKLLKNKD